MKPWLLALLLAFAFAQAGKPKELFENGGFEKGLAGWRALNQSGGCWFEPDTKVKKEGQQSLRVERRTGEKIDFLKGFLELPVREGTLSVALAYKLDKDAHLSAQVYFYDRDDKELGKGFIDLVEARKPTKNFETVRKELEIPKNAHGLGVNFLFDTPGTLWLDEFSVSVPQGKGKPPKPAKPGALANPGFEEGLDAWLELAGSGTLALRSDTQHKQAGKAALELGRASPRLYPPDGVHQRIENPGPAKRWKLSGSAQTEGGARAVLLLRAYDAAGVPCECARGVFGAPEGKQEFARLEIELVLPEARELFEVELLVEGSGKARFDTLALEGK